MTLFCLLAGFVAFVVAWFKSIKRQVLNHAPHKMKLRQHHFTHHTPSGGVSRAQIGG